MTTTELPPAALVVEHRVENFDEWYEGFLNHEDARRGASAIGHHINRKRDDPNLVTIYLAITDIDRAKEFANSEDLKEVMEKVGVISAPTMHWMTPVRENIVWDRQLPALLLDHRVDDFGAWLEGYDAADELRKSHGVIGHAANRSIDDPSMAIVYHQAETFADLETFLADPELKTVMDNAGVISEPEVDFHTGGWAKQY